MHKGGERQQQRESVSVTVHVLLDHNMLDSLKGLWNKINVDWFLVEIQMQQSFRISECSLFFVPKSSQWLITQRWGRHRVEECFVEHSSFGSFSTSLSVLNTQNEAAKSNESMKCSSNLTKLSSLLKHILILENSKTSLVQLIDAAILVNKSAFVETMRGLVVYF